MDLEVRYLAAIDCDFGTLKSKFEDYFIEIEADDYDPLDETTLSTFAIVTTSYQLELNIECKESHFGGFLVIFDISSATAIEIDIMQNLIAEPAKQFFDEIILVYNSLGHERHTQALPVMFGFENLFREFAIYVLLQEYGKNWWDNIKHTTLGNKTVGAEVEKMRNRSKKDELHDFYDFFNGLYFLNFDDLRQVIEADIANNNNSLFKDILTERHGVNVVISELVVLHSLRNHIMHGKYLSAQNLRSLEEGTDRVQIFLSKKGHLGRSKIMKRPY